MSGLAAPARALAFMRAIDQRASSRVERLPFGTAYLRPELPQVWSRNFVWVDSPAERIDVPAVVEEAERVHADAGLTHRRLVFQHEGAAGAAAVVLQPHGWLPGRNLIMPHLGPAAAPPPPSGAREVKPEELHRARREVMKLDPLTSGDDTMSQLLAADAVVGEVTSERCFAYVADGKVVAFCRLYSDGATAQIEDVETVPEYRRRGFSRAAVLLALREAWAAHDFVFIEADSGDWPKDWYQRLGFEPAAVLCQLLRRP